MDAQVWDKSDQSTTRTFNPISKALTETTRFYNKTLTLTRSDVQKRLVQTISLFPSPTPTLSSIVWPKSSSTICPNGGQPFRFTALSRIANIRNTKTDIRHENIVLRCCEWPKPRIFCFYNQHYDFHLLKFSTKMK